MSLASLARPLAQGIQVPFRPAEPPTGCGVWGWLPVAARPHSPVLFPQGACSPLVLAPGAWGVQAAPSWLCTLHFPL